jgi:hypothetical protein
MFGPGWGVPACRLARGEVKVLQNGGGRGTTGGGQRLETLIGCTPGRERCTRNDTVARMAVTP